MLSSMTDALEHVLTCGEYVIAPPHVYSGEVKFTSSSVFSLVQNLVVQA